MIKFAFLFCALTSTAFAYVPTVESLFRHGGNADMLSSANTVTMTLKVQRVPPTVEEGKRAEDFYKIFITKTNNDSMKLSQTRYENNSYSEASLEQKVYYPNFTAHTISPNPEQIEKGIFFALMRSLTLNDGEHMVQYLKSLGVPVKLNSELINREKIEVLAAYKKYLIAVNRDRKKNEINPLRPEDASERARIEKIMAESMYVDTKQVKLTREGTDMAWMTTAGPFTASVSYDKKNPLKIKYQSESGEFEISCHDYWLADGVHYLPKYFLIKNFNGELYRVDLGSYRQYTEREDDLVNRLQKWDQLLKGKETATTARPEFLL